MSEIYTNGKIKDANVAGYSPLHTPYKLKDELPGKASEQLVKEGRRAIKNILKGEDRVLIVAGPCSIHDLDAAMDYSQRLLELRNKVKDRFEIVMRAYFEKPRTTVGWKGLIYEPDLDGTGDINKGLYLARKMLRDITNSGLPVGTEFLDPFVPQYIDDLVSWGSIGARTVESPQHRHMASGLSMPVGFKNSTSGSVDAAINAIKAARHKGHSFFGLNEHGIPAVITTLGNPNTHMILRGGEQGPNYDTSSIAYALSQLGKSDLEQKLMVDCSHGNSSKNYANQPVVFEEVVRQIRDGNKGIMGIMLESNIKSGRQDITDNLEYGVSVTDACIDWETTQKLVMEAHKSLDRIIA